MDETLNGNTKSMGPKYCDRNLGSECQEFVRIYLQLADSRMGGGGVTIR